MTQQSTPDTQPNLLCWLEPSLGGMYQDSAGSATPAAANGDAVRFVPDHSAGGVNATSLADENYASLVTGSMGGQTCLRFTGAFPTPSLLTLGNPATWNNLKNGGMTVVMAVNVAAITYNPGYGMLFGKEGGGGDPTTAALLWLSTPDFPSPQMSRYPNLGSAGPNAAFLPGVVTLAKNLILTYKREVVLSSFSQSQPPMVKEQFFINGYPCPPVYQVPGSAWGDDNPWVFGGLSPGYFAIGFDMGFFAMYGQGLSDEQRAVVESYAAGKYGCARSQGLPAPSLPPVQVQYTGDSLTIGINSVANGDYPSQVSALLGGSPTALNWGISGLGIAGILPLSSSREDYLLQSPGTSNINVLWAGTNDLADHVSPATVYANIQTYCQARRAAGHQVVVLTPLPRNNVFGGGQTAAGFETDRQTLRALILAGGSALADGIVDVGASGTITVGGVNFDMSAIGAAGAYSNTTYYSVDLIHLTNAGYALVAAPVAAIVRAMDTARHPASIAAALTPLLPTDYQQRGTAVTLPDGVAQTSDVQAATTAANAATAAATTTPANTVSALKADATYKQIVSHAAGKYTFDPTTNTLTLYEADGVTVLKTQTLTANTQGVVTERA